MTNLDPDICKKLRDARRERGISQSSLSKEVGCKQSALSMFEQGDGTKLNDEVIKKLCDKFGIELPQDNATLTEVQSPVSVSRVYENLKGFCPNPACPSHTSYEVDGRAFLKPDRAQQDPVGGKFCAICGEVLEKRCPNCGAAVHDGAVCSHCGENYISLA